MILEGETKGLNKFRDAIEPIINEGELGSDGTEVKVSDTGLGTPIATTSVAVVTTKFNKGIKIDYATTLGLGAGNSAREWVVNDTDTDELLRVVFPEIELHTNSVISISSQLILLQEL